MWQALYDELSDAGFTVLAVAMDQPDAARPWIEAVTPKYPCLIDRNHHLAELYGFVNVPQAVWIDEQGRIVRPAETAGATDGFRSMDRTTFTMPQAVIDERNRVKARYLDAVRDWARRGCESVHALSPEQVAARFVPVDPSVALAHAHFRLGLHLVQQDRQEEAREQFARAIDLHPDSWAIWRQAAAKDARGLASGPEFWARVDALGERRYYPPSEITG